MLIGLTGRAQAGKDTVCERLRAVAVAEVVRHGFADKVYECAAACLGVDVETLRDLKTEERSRVQLVTLGAGSAHDVHALLADTSVRGYLQKLGTEGHRRIFGDDFWIKQVSPDPTDGRIHVVTDVRFDNEAAHIRSLGGIVVRVVGPQSIELVPDGHASEQPVLSDLIDAYVENGRRDDGFASLDSQLPELLARAAATRKPRLTITPWERS